MGKMNDKVWALVIFSVVFAVVYQFCLWYASSLGNVSSFVFSFEKNIPFIPWTIIPYLSSGAFFCVVFFLIKSKDALSVFLKRVLLITVLAGIGFVLMPLQYSYAKPEIDNSVFHFLFWFLDGVDDPYNQSPSLHVAFAFAFWTVFRELQTKWKILSAVWLSFVALSTLTTYQHHLIDVFTGSILAHIVFILIPSQPKNDEVRNFNTANYYFLSAWITFLAAFLLGENYGPFWLNLIWLALAMFILGFITQKYQVRWLQREAVRISIFKRFL